MGTTLDWPNRPAAGGNDVQIDERSEGAALVLSPQGRIDNDTAQGFQARLLAGLTAPGSVVVVDLAGVEYMSSAGLRALMVASKQAKANQGKVGVAALQSVVKEIFAISRFSFVVPVFDTPAAALAKLG